MRVFRTLLLSLTVMGIAFATNVPEVHAQAKPTCSVRDGVNFHSQKNYGKAFECWDQHARLGSSAAQFNIARMYVLGEGVPRNKIEAFKWLTIADRSGRPEARKVLANIRKTMTAEEVEEAQKRIQKHYTGGR
tara:strand:- start:22590 stop:22988 length:399 start_codon:yes stop_codon:yes gene_type:complete